MSNVTNGRAKTQMKVWRPQGFAGVEIWDINNARESVPPEVLNAYHIALTKTDHDHGIVCYRGENIALKGRCFNFYQEGEVTSYIPSNHAACNGTETSYNVFRVPSSLIKEVTANSKAPMLKDSVVASNLLNDAFARIFIDTLVSFQQETAHLERESKLFGLLYAFLKHCSDTPPPEQKLGKEHRAVSLVKEVFQSHPEQDHTLDNLSLLTKLNKYYLWEVFKRDVGLSPDQYQTCLRVHKAKDLLARGTPIVKTALDAGFSDQSHLTRVFKKYTQVTPGRFQKDTLSS